MSVGGLGQGAPRPAARGRGTGRGLWTMGVLMSLAGGVLVQAKEASLTITARQRALAVQNAARFEWARAEQEAARKAAAPWLAMSDEELWDLIPSQELPRSIHVFNVAGTNRIALCPKCREGIIPFGNYPWRTYLRKRPWKIECPNCHSIFPGNDFGAYYRSALDEHGFFRKGRGNPALLVNVEHPDPADPLHRAFVDDGYGWTDAEGTRWDFIAVYAHMGLWPAIKSAIDALARAYTLTDDAAYAHKCGVLLTRLADVYPEMDWHPLAVQGFSHSCGGSRRGRVEGRIWETGNGTRWALAYDHVFDALVRDAELAAFADARHKAQALAPLPTPEAVTAHIESGLIREIIRGVRDGRIRGNEGMHHTTMIAAALALDRPDETPALIDWVFAPGAARDIPGEPGRQEVTGGNLANVIVSIMDRDGLGNEGAPGYSLWGASLQRAADLLEDNARYRRHSIYRDFPKYRQYYHAAWRWSCLDAATPPIGDSGAACAWGLVTPGAPALLRAFGIYRDEPLARLAWLVSGRSLEGVRGSIFEEDPEALRREVAAVVEGPEPPLTSRFLDGWGLAILQAPYGANGRALWLYFGRNTGHGHLDRLNLGLYAENLDMLPDFGYPEYASGRPKDLAWCRNNAAHNVPTVDGAAQVPSYTGRLLAFEPEGRARLMEAASDGLYPGAGTCRRTAWLIDVDERSSYVLDIVRVRGGKTHTLSWHGPPGELTTAGLMLRKQASGTYAGPDVPFESLPRDWPRRAGYSFLYNVERAADPPAAFTADYRAVDTRGRIAADREPHLRLHILTPLQEVALADGDPPQNKPKAPRRMRFVLATRTGEDLESVFVTVLEPYDRAPVLASVRRLGIVSAAPGANPAAVEVALPDGRVDTIVSCEAGGRVEVEGGIVMDGMHGYLTRRGGRVEYAKLMSGTLLACEGFQLRVARAAYTGTIARVLPEDPWNQHLELSEALPAAAAQAGRTIFIANDGRQDAAYTIAAPPAERLVSLGGITLVRGYTDPADPARGFVYNVAPGDAWRVPTMALVDLAAGARFGSAPFEMEARQ